MFTSIPLTKKQRASIDSDDFERLSRYTWHAVWSVNTQSYYAFRKTSAKLGRRRTQGMHREVMGLALDDPREVDHINRDTLDNRKSNLRIVDARENSENRKDQSKYGAGIQKLRNRFRAKARLDGKQIHIGMYGTPEEAREARRLFIEEHERR